MTDPPSPALPYAPAVHRRPTILLLGGTTEATALADALGPRVGVDLDLIVSFAGRTARPTAPAGQVRVGGFGGVSGLVDHLRSAPVDVVVDALHPFAAVMPFHAAKACHQVGLPLLKLQRPAWIPSPQDRWTEVADMSRAAGAVRGQRAKRVLLTIGRQELDPFRGIEGPTFLVRSIEAPDLAGAWAATARLDRGPFTEDGERDLFEAERSDLLVTKNSGGAATAPKLAAARDLAITVVMVERPPRPDVPTVASVEQALAWLDAQVQAPG